MTDVGPSPFGTKADLQVGNMLVAERHSDYWPSVVSNYVYFAATVNGAAELTAGDADPRVYVVGATGEWEDDPDVIDKKVPGNHTRSHRGREPIRVGGEVHDWSP